MIELQDFIHKLEEGIGARIIKGITVALGLLMVAAVYDWREYRCFSTQDAMDNAQLARNIAEGRGYTTGFIRPFSLHLLQKKAKSEGRNPNEVLRSPHPDLVNPPVYPLLVAGLMKVLPFQYTLSQEGEFSRYQPELIITAMNQVFFVASILLLFFLARRLFDPTVAWLASAIFAGTDLLWRYSVSGLSTMLLLLIILGLLSLVVAMDHRQQEAKSGEAWFLAMAAGVGLLAGLGCLTRYSFGFVIVPIVVYFLIYFAQRRIAVAGVALIVFLAVLAPWIARNWMVSGTPLGVAGYAAIQETPYFPGDRLLRSLNPDFRIVMVEDFFRKLLVNVGAMVSNDLPKLGGSWLSAFFLVGLLMPYRNPALNRLRVLTVLILPVFAIVQALSRTHASLESPEVNADQLLIFLVPLVFIFGAALFNQLLDQIELPFPPVRTWVAGAFGVLMCLPLIFTFLPPRSFPVVYPPYHPPLIQQSASWVDEKELMMSDIPWAVSWYGNRTCLWNTLSVSPEFFEISDFQKPIVALYLTQVTTDAKFQTQIVRGEDLAWGRFYVESLLRSNLPPGWPLRHAPAGFLESGQMFITDRPRWKWILRRDQLEPNIKATATPPPKTTNSPAPLAP